MKKMSKKSRKGFTLIELIIVILILAVLAAIAIPAYAAYRERAELAANEASAKVAYDAMLVLLASGETAANAAANYNTLIEPDITATPVGTVGAAGFYVTVGSGATLGRYPAS